MVNMCLIKYHVLIFCLIIIDCYALNCRSDGGPKEAELKNIYKKCLKMQEGTQSNNSKGSPDQDRRESRGHSQKHEWDSQEGDNSRNKDYANNGRDSTKSNNRNRINGKNGMNDKQDRRNIDRNDDRMEDRRRADENDRNSMVNNERYGRDDYFSNRGDFPRNGDFGGGDIPHYNYYPSTQSPRRYRREKRPENSGQRSQYNPNKQRISGFEDYRSDENNSSDNNSKEMDNKACAMHCFLENLEMTGDNGMPDRYLVTHVITKEVKNEDLKDFLQESIEECFQILDNENTEDKCNFSKNLLMCLSEKGRANCDDWKDDLKF